MIRNIVFDMGNVLLRFSMMDYCAAHVEAEEDRALVYRELFASLEWVMLDRGSISFEDATARICARLPQRLHGLIRPMIDGWHGHMTPMPGMRELVAELLEKGYRVYLLSNTAKSYHHFRENIPCVDRFSGEFISADHGQLKPDHRIYEAFLREYGLQAAECFFVDDMNTNVEGAIHVGFSGMVFRGSAEGLRLALREAGVDM